MYGYLLFTIMLFTVPQHAQAYLDPGTGSMILQGIVAAVAVVGFTLKNYWYKIRAIFGKTSPQSLLNESDEPAEPK